MLKITIITVCYNEKNKIRKTLESVLAQTYPNIEYLIMDGASTDGTRDILQEYASCNNIHIYSEKDFGIYNAMNRGITRATGDYVLFLNAGDFLSNKHIVEDACSYIKDEDTVYYGKACYVSADGSETVTDFFRQKGTLEEKLLDGAMPCHQSIFAPGKLLTNHYFNEQYKIRADYEWLMYTICRCKKTLKELPLTISYCDETGVSSRAKYWNLLHRETQLIIKEYQGEYKQDLIDTAQSEELAKWRELSEKHLFLFQLLNQWMILKQRGFSLGMYFEQNGLKSVAVYGMGHLGERLLQELKDFHIHVAYLIDKNASNINTDLPVYVPEANLEEVDAVIVTAVMYYMEIEALLHKKMKCPVISLEDIILEMAVKNKISET